MLKSYEYSEQQYTDIVLQASRFFSAEVDLAKRFVDDHISNEPVLECPFCGEAGALPFFVKWGVLYRRCEKCGSVYVNCDPEVLEAYRRYQPMIDLRASGEYQADAAKMRDDTWSDFILWLTMRTFRFIHRKEGLDIIDIGTRYRHFSRMISADPLCGRYDLRHSILQPETAETVEQADIVLYMHQIQQSYDPKADLAALRPLLKRDGLLILNTRAGSGYDILTLKGRNSKVFPYEHVRLPSKNGLVALLHQCGYKPLEITTPGVMDMNYLIANSAGIPREDLFARYLATEADNGAIQEFQRFLQKNFLSSFMQIIAIKEN